MKIVNKYYPLYIFVLGILPLIIEYQKEFTSVGTLSISICFALVMSIFALICWYGNGPGIVSGTVDGGPKFV